MTCKLGDKCDNVFACNILRPNVELLGCNFYKPKKPLTNEEWLHTLNTEQLAECLTNISFNTGYDSYNVVLQKIGEWLKQPHIKE